MLMGTNRRQIVPQNSSGDVRNQNLDVLRGVAILLVLGSHYDYFHFWARIGWCGVDLFFVLSGFLISGLLFKEYRCKGQLDIRRFWIRRCFKIWPPFYVFMAFTAIIFIAKHRAPPIALLHDSLFIGNYSTHYWDHSWSLAVEEHFYLILPILLAGIIKISRDKSDPFRTIPGISVALTVACFYLRSRALHVNPFATAIALPTHLRIDSLFAGVALGYYYQFESASFRRMRPLGLWLGASLLIAPVVLLSLRNAVSAATYTLTYAAFCCVLIAMVNRPPSNRLPNRALALIGTYSYSIYLWHAAILANLFGGLKPTLPLFGSYILLSIGAGVFMNKLIEKPSLAFRDYCFLPQEPTMNSTAEPSALLVQ